MRRYGFDGAILFADILLIPHGLGQRVDYVENEGPRLDPLEDAAAIGRLDLDAAAAALAPVGETVARVRAATPPEVAVIGFAGAPWTVATYMIGGGRGLGPAVERLHRDPAGVEALIDLLVEATIPYLRSQIEAGADVIQIFDSWAGCLPPEAVDRCCIEPTRRILDALHSAHPRVPAIGFPRGVGRGAFLAYAEAAGIDAISIGQELDAEWAAAALPPGMAAQGNLDPGLLSAGGDIEGAVDRVLRAFRGRPHVFNLGHGIRPETDPANVGRLVRAVRRRSGGDGPPPA